MKKLIISLVLVFSLAVALNYALAQEEAVQETSSVLAEEQITAADLGVEDPGILPTSRLYFFKSWGRNIQRVFTFNPVKRAALELDIVNHQAAEIAKIKEVAPDRVDAITKASQNYQDNADRLNSRLEALKDTSENPNVDKLMENLADRSVKHQQLFDELKQKFEDKPELKQNLEKMQNKMHDALIKIPEKFDSPEEFQKRMKKAIEARPDTPFREIRGMEMMEKIKEKLPEGQRPEFETIKDDLMKQFEEKNVFIMPHVLERMPGDPVLRAKLLEEMQNRIHLSPKLGEQIEASKVQILEKAVERGEITKEKAEEQIKRAEAIIEKLRLVVNDTTQRFLEQAKKHLNEAKTAFAIGKYGDAFGRAITAEAEARNGLRNIESFRQEGCLPRPVCLDATPRCLLPEPVGGWCSASSTGEPSLLKTTEPALLPMPLSEPSPAIIEKIVCTQEYDAPVCGIDGKTYSNACYAKSAGVGVSYSGQCRSLENKTDSTYISPLCSLIPPQPICPENTKPLPKYNEYKCIIGYECVK